MLKPLKRNLLFVLILLFQLGLMAQSASRPVPPGELHPYEFHQLDTSFRAHYCFAPTKMGVGPNHPDYIPPRPIILDEDGYLLWYGNLNSSRTQTNFGFNADENQFFLVGGPTPGTMYFMRLNPDLSIVDSVETLGATNGDIHEFLVNSSGNRILAGKKNQVFDLSSYTFNGNPGSANTTVRCFMIQEIAPNGTLVWEWNSCDYIHPSEGYDSYGYAASLFDYCHGNAIEEDTDGNYLISMRHCNAIYKISRSDGSIIWQLGGKSNQFTFVNDSGFSGQHDIRRQADGSLSLFDNANSSSNPKVSRAVRYVMDTSLMTVNKVWEYIPSTPFFARAMGNAQFADSVWMVGFGMDFRPYPSAEVVDLSGNVLTRVEFLDSVVNYRGTIFEPTIVYPRPVISCYVDNGDLHLVAPLGHSQYLWSDGQTGQDIVVTLGETYQVFVPYGVGMLGSEPVLADVNCLISGIEVDLQTENAVLIRVVDLLGREVNQRKSGQVYLEIYSNGNVRKVVRLE